MEHVLHILLNLFVEVNPWFFKPVLGELLFAGIFNESVGWLHFYCCTLEVLFSHFCQLLILSGRTFIEAVVLYCELP